MALRICLLGDQNSLKHIKFHSEMNGTFEQELPVDVAVINELR